MTGILKEFKEFAVKGNLLDLSVGLIIGGAFSKIVNSFVSDILMAPVNSLLGKANFNDYFVVLSGGEYSTLEAAKAAGAVTINYGSFISSLVDFLIVAVILFILVKQINLLRKKIHGSGEHPVSG